MPYQHPGMWAKPFILDRCRRCRQPTLAGATDGFTLTTDAYALTVSGELQAVLAGRRTFTAGIHGRKIALYRREAWNIQHSPDALVVAEHQCHAPALDRDASRSLQFIDILLPRIRETECPF